MLSAVGTAHAQLNGLHLKGDAGLDSSSQAPPGTYGGTVFYWYDTFQPVNLGWKLKRADVIAAFGFFAPTGRYTAENPNGDNTGFGMWGFEPSVGTTVHLNESKTWNASALASFEFHTDKRDTVQYVGNILTLERWSWTQLLEGHRKGRARILRPVETYRRRFDWTAAPTRAGKESRHWAGAGTDDSARYKKHALWFLYVSVRVGSLRADDNTGECLNPDSCVPLQADQAQVVCSPFERSCEKCDETVARPW
jgi:Putative MetA-pathway of phenol degradation